MKNKKLKLFLILSIILFCYLFSTIVYSAISSTVKITGDAYARPVKDVRITNFKLNSLSGGATVSYAEFSSNTISTKIHLVDGYSTAKFDVEVTNYGNVDVGILNINNDSNADVRYDLYNYKITEKLCDENDKCNNMAVKTFQMEISGIPGDYELIYTFDFRTYHSVTYTGITNNNYPTEVIDGGRLNIKFTEDLKKIAFLKDGIEFDYYDQISSGQNITINNVTGDIEIKKKESVAKLVSGKIDEVGSEVCIKDECFYIINNDGSTVSMLAKYNLHVGNIVDENNNATPLSNPTGKQDITAVATNWDDESQTTIYPRIGTTALEKTGEYVNSYKSYLITQGVTLTEARLITKDEVISLGCNETSKTCTGAPDWVYGTSYWLNVSRWYVINSADFDYLPFSTDVLFGVRPVIEMSVDEIKLPEKAVMISGDYDTVGSEVVLGDEHFYVISSTDTTVTMLSKHNVTLDVTSKQSVDAGTTVFSSDSKKGTYYSDYSGSIVEGYVSNYKTKLESDYGVDVVEARLITYDEVSSLGCTFDVIDGMCELEYNWVYSVGYWTGTAYSSETIIQISRDGLIGEAPYYIEFRGVRPVITISKSNF